MAWLKIGRTLAATLSVLTLMGGSPGAVASTASHGSGRILEVDVTNSPDVRNGQPAVAVNPRNPRNLVFTATVFAPGVPTPPGECFLAHSRDRGETWTRVPWPLGDRPACGEPNLAVDARGTFYVLSNQLGPDSTANILSNNVVVSRSLDGGRTWSEPVQTPLRIGGTPKLRVDAATGKVYAVGGFSWLLPSGVSVSADQGNTWSPPALIPGPLPCSPSPVPGLPDICGFPGRQIAVHAGILAAATQEEGVAFHVSRDDGQSWTSSPVTTSDGVPVPAGVGPLVPGTPTGGAAADPVPWVSADPKQPGRFAVMVPRDGTFEVYVTRDAGRTWTGPAVIAALGAVRPWMDFGSNGLLGVMWRTTAVDAYSVVSFDHGRSFSAPLRVNSAAQVAGDSGPPGDDWSWITLDRRYVYVTWSDARTGGSIDGILARVPLSAYLRAH